jgi:hypothetical protein
MKTANSAIQLFNHEKRRVKPWKAEVQSVKCGFDKPLWDCSRLFTPNVGWNNRCFATLNGLSKRFLVLGLHFHDF